jgi:hypothetical protein
LALKILIAGDRTPEFESFFYDIAKSLSEDHTNNMIYYLSTEKRPVFKDRVSKKLVKYGFGHHVFEYNPSETE